MADRTALQRQNKRIDRLKEQKIGRTTVLVHDECRPALDELRTYLVDALKAPVLDALVASIVDKKPVNVSQVRQLSPFRYPGGKTWLVPEVRKWIKSAEVRPQVFVEPFAGGAMAGLSMAAEDLADEVVLCELDSDVAAVWSTIFNGSDADVRWLQTKITSFTVSLEAVKKVLESKPKSDKTTAFRTVIKNRMQRGGIMAPGAGLVKEGEGGKGLLSRWYPQTLSDRIGVLRTLLNKVSFVQGDAFTTIRQHTDNPNAFFFVDPPYTAGGKKAGSRLYTHNELDHEALFDAMANTRGEFMLTYDDSPEVRALAEKHGFRIEQVAMKNTHHAIVYELLIFRS